MTARLDKLRRNEATEGGFERAKQKELRANGKSELGDWTERVACL